MMTERTTWKRLATIFAAGLHDNVCTDHEEHRDDCPYCRDTVALQVYRSKIAGRSDWSWRDVATKLATRFQHFAECTDHKPKDADPENCPFCHDKSSWQRYVDFCGRQGVTPVRRDADIIHDGAVVSIFDLRNHSVWPTS